MYNLTIEKITEIFRDKSKLEDFIQSLDGESFEEFLLTLHSKFINIDKKDDRIWDDFVGVGFQQGTGIDLCAPDFDTKKSLLDKIPKCIKKLSDNKERGTLLHYLINEVHFFSDGNGRTGRAMLELFFNNDFDLKNDTFRHKTSDSSESKGNESFQLEEKYGIKRIDKVTAYTSYILTKILYENGMLYDEIEITKFIAACNTADGQRDSSFINNNELTKKEIEQVSIALRDNTGVIGPGALTMLIMGKVKGKPLPKSVYDEYYFTGFDLTKADCFEGWNTEDYIKSIKIHSKLQELQLNILLEIFENPEIFQAINSTTVKNCFIQDLNKRRLTRAEIVELASSLKIDLISEELQVMISDLDNIINEDTIARNCINFSQIGEEVLSSVEKNPKQYLNAIQCVNNGIMLPEVTKEK